MRLCLAPMCDALLCNACNLGHFVADSILLRRRADMVEAFRANKPDTAVVLGATTTPQEAA